MRPRRSQVAPDRCGLLPDRVVAAVAGLVRHDRGDQLERRQHGPPTARVRPRLALQPARRSRRRADAELAQLPVLRGSVEGHHATVGQDRASAAGQLRWASLRTSLLLVVAACGSQQQPAGHERQQRRQDLPRRPPPGVSAGRRAASPPPGGGAGPPHPCWKCRGRTLPSAIVANDRPMPPVLLAERRHLRLLRSFARPALPCRWRRGRRSARAPRSPARAGSAPPTIGRTNPSSTSRFTSAPISRFTAALPIT